jgi:hypothetical protein
MRVPRWPNVTVVNALGDFAISYPRLALIDGEIDPWRPCTPHSRYAQPRNDTISEPFKLIPSELHIEKSILILLLDCFPMKLTKVSLGGVHHHDQNGLRNPDREPLHIQAIHQEEVEFVKTWLKEWKHPK